MDGLAFLILKYKFPGAILSSNFLLKGDFSLLYTHVHTHVHKPPILMVPTSLLPTSFKKSLLPQANKINKAITSALGNTFSETDTAFFPRVFRCPVHGLPYAAAPQVVLPQHAHS